MTQLTFWLLVALTSSISYVFMVGYMRRYVIKTKQIYGCNIKDKIKVKNFHNKEVVCSRKRLSIYNYTSATCKKCEDSIVTRIIREKEAVWAYWWPAWLIKVFFLKIHKAGTGFED